MRKPEDPSGDGGAESCDLSFLDSPEVTRWVFHPRRTGPTPKVPGRLHPITFIVDDMVNVDGAVHFAERSVEDAPNILFFHGNGETVADYREMGSLYGRIGINFAVIDYRGYGTSGGDPSYSAMMRDAVSIFPQYADLLAYWGLSGPIFVMGRSLGSSPALEVAVGFQKRISGLILESGFADTYRLLERLGVDPQNLDALGERAASNHEKMKKVMLPVLIIHGEGDEIIPLSEGVILFEDQSCREKEILIIRRAGHNDLLILGIDEYFNAIARFVGRVRRL
ncbi:alpha/beta hydrolase [Methanotrichaceae archaeon M04Ac]|uniref:Alpha/beta hydrolase n=1 Tax=Candidatus Methanocrinis alkalitolerans TaxID=3033395 RepID=A0ABT5XFP0_9EURY|nr:alpha/beta hydrolase [Candidatus Methanocrinis alkalitolerans]MCR3883233.1 alpha/beta hydrolase [Methanothrix sp.]MDF0593516.1 alpha/beta hydrolase [Candidatus Methanocrinis alkalitolerans]